MLWTHFGNLELHCKKHDVQFIASLETQSSLIYVSSCILFICNFYHCMSLIKSVVKQAWYEHLFF
jgi:hypothetical protein